MASLATESGRSRIDVVAFDFDGTLAETSEAILITAARTFASLGLPPLARERFSGSIGIPLLEAFRRHGMPEAQLDEGVSVYRRLFPEALGSIRLFPGAHDCLVDLTALGLRLGIVSSRGRGSLDELLTRLDIAQHFEAILGQEDAARHKPAPDLLLSLGARLGVEPAHMLVVGDTSYDIQMGHAAGAVTCAVTYGNHGLDQLEPARPHHRLDSLHDLTTLVRSVRSA